MIALVDRIKKTAPDPDTHSKVKIGKSENNRTPAQKIPAPEPAGMGPEYADLWNRAWELAEWIDNPDGAPLADRKAKLPELLALRDRMAEIERQHKTPERCPAGERRGI